MIKKKVRDTIEEQRLLLGLDKDQVLFNTDMYGSTSGTFNAMVRTQTYRKVVVKIAIVTVLIYGSTSGA